MNIRAMAAGMMVAAGAAALCGNAAQPVFEEIVAGESVFRHCPKEPEFTVDFSQANGRIRRINGLNNWAPTSDARGPGLTEELKALRIPYARFHDDPLINPGKALVDISFVFPLFDADENDPKNYIFGPTDEYIGRAHAAGVKLEYRLGESIEHSNIRYRVKPPKDYAKWARICEHIIRHYNEGWADGFHWNIERWSIWEEANTIPTLMDDPNGFYGVYFDMYRVVAPYLKEKFPNIKLGAPQCNNNVKNSDDFIDFVAKEKLPLDIFGCDVYCRRPEYADARVRHFREHLDKVGYKDTIIEITEYHLGPVSWAGHGTRRSELAQREWEHDLAGNESTAYLSASLTLFQDAPVDMVYFYNAKSKVWGLFDKANCPYGSYWAMMAFADLADYPVRVNPELKPMDGWYLLASKSEDGKKARVLVTTYLTDDSFFDIKIKGGMKPVRMRALDAIRQYEESDRWEWHEEDGGFVRVWRDYCRSAVFLIDFEAK